MQTLILVRAASRLLMEIESMRELAIIMTAIMMSTMFKMNFRVFGVESELTY